MAAKVFHRPDILPVLHNQQAALCICPHIQTREQVWRLPSGHIRIPGHFLLAHKLRGDGKGCGFQRHILECYQGKDRHRCRAGFPAPCAPSDILAIEEHFKVLSTCESVLPLVEHRQDGDEHIGIVFVQNPRSKMVLIIIIRCLGTFGRCPGSTGCLPYP